MNPSTDFERLGETLAPSSRQRPKAAAPKARTERGRGTSTRLSDSGTNGEAATIQRRARVRESDSTEALWRRYSRRRDDETRNQLVARYQGLVTEIVRHFAQRLPRSVDRDDLATASSFGLMSAIENFDPARGVRFESYCELRVKGALIDELRTQDWLPRPRRARLEQRKRVMETLRSELAREPDEGEIAQAMGLAPDAYQAIFGGLVSTAPATGQGESDVDPLALFDVVADEESAEAEDKLTRDEILRLVTSKLSVQEYRLIYLKYWEELSMREIGAMMRLSESAVCKLHQNLLERLQDRFGDAAND